LAYALCSGRPAEVNTGRSSSWGADVQLYHLKLMALLELEYLRASVIFVQLLVTVRKHLNGNDITNQQKTH
jgi:hypothetical protein